MAVALKRTPAALRNGKSLPALPIHRFTVDEYHQMIKTGVLREDDRVELLEGWVVEKMPQNPNHSGTISILLRILQTLLPGDWIIRVQSPVTLANSEPEPNLAVVRGPEERYCSAHPKPGDIGIVIEVADTTLEEDQTAKARVYAKAAIPHYWIVNLVAAAIEVHSRPKAGKNPKYQTKEILDLDQEVRVILAGRTRGTFPVRRLFP